MADIEFRPHVTGSGQRVPQDLIIINGTHYGYVGVAPDSPINFIRRLPQELIDQVVKAVEERHPDQGEIKVAQPTMVDPDAVKAAAKRKKPQ